MDMLAEFFLSSVESKAFGDVRACRVTNRAVFEGTGKHALWVEVHPGVDQDVTGAIGSTQLLLLTTRYKGEDIWSFDRFPLQVHIAAAADPTKAGSKSIRVDELHALAWGEIYATREYPLGPPLESEAQT